MWVDDERREAGQRCVRGPNTKGETLEGDGVHWDPEQQW